MGIAITIGFSAITIIFGIYKFFKLKKGTNYILSKVEDALMQLKEMERNEGHKRAGYLKVEKIFENNKLLGHSWVEFKECIVEEQDDDEDEVYYYNTEDAGHYFKLDSIFKDKHNLRMYENVPSILTSIGIIGTFVGIILGLLHFSIDDMKGSISFFLEGMKTAFFTSIIGLVSANLFLYREKDYTNNIEGKVFDLIDTLDKIFKKKSEQDYLIEIQKISDRQLGQFKSLANDIGKEVANNLMGMGGSSIDQALKDGMNNGFKFVVEEINKFLEFQKSYQHTLGEILGNLNEENKVVEKNIQSLKEVNELLSTNTVSFTEASSNLSRVSSNLGETVSKSVDAIKSQGDMIDEVIDSIQKQKDNIQQVNLSASNIVQQTSDIVGKLSEQNKEFVADTSKYLSTLNSSVEKTLDSFDDELSKGVKKLNGLFRNHDDAMTELEIFFSKLSTIVQKKEEGNN